MAKGKKKGGGGGGGGMQDFRREQALQAVVLADSFTTKMRPVTLDMPKVRRPFLPFI
mgnify:CR=1 FL=1